MKFTLRWLKDFLDTNASLPEILARLTALGLEVEGVVDRAEELKHFIVAEVKSARRHPSADKLQVCEVFDGKNTLQVVCGAPNARAGIKVVLAPIGAVIPANGMMIKQSKIRDVESNGMLCSASELNLGTESDGIIELDPGSIVGENFAKISGLDDPIIELSITPNRGDCLGVYGIARDLAASGLGTLKNIEKPPLTDYGFASPIKVNIEPGSGCLRFIGRYFKEVKNSLISPDWMRNNLSVMGCKSISILVDITNLICYSFGRPLHVFDADKIKGNIIVRQAKPGEKFIALNDVEYKLVGGEMVIGDDSGVIALAGIIGGKSTGCDENTRNVFLEMALFDPIKISNSGRLHMIDTDSRYRFERKLDPGFIESADIIASNLIWQLCGGTYSANIDVSDSEFADRYVEYRIESFNKKAGFEIGEQKIIEILNALQFGAEKTSDSKYRIKIPTWRNDVSIEDDITEEILRIYGYDNIPTTRIPSSESITKPVLSVSQNNINIATRKLASLGYNEIVSWSFMDLMDAASFIDIDDELKIVNPISADLSYMRPSIIPNLLTALKNNMARGFDNLSLFEIGPVFDKKLELYQQIVCAGVRSGLATRKNVHQNIGKFDVFDIKRDIFAVIEECGFDPYKLQINQDKKAPKWYHPAQSASISLGKNIIGYFGKLSPVILAKYEIDSNSYGFEFYLKNLPIAKSKHGKCPPADFSAFQAVRRDFAFILDQEIPAGSLTRVIEAVDKKLIKDINIFDHFVGNTLGEGKKSVALSVTIQASDRTLVESEIDFISDSIIAEVKSKTGGVLRS